MSKELTGRSEKRRGIGDPIWVAIIGALAVIIGALIQVVMQPSHPPNLDNQKHSVAPSSDAPRPQINSLTIGTPQKNTEVGPRGTVTGLSSLRNTNHYLVVTPASTQTRTVVHGPFQPEPDRPFAVPSRFGSGKVGLDENFDVEILATSTPFSEGEDVASLPADAVMSDRVTVHRSY